MKIIEYYEDELKKEIEEDRIARGKTACKKKGRLPVKKTKVPKEKEIKVSTVNSDCGVFHKGQHKAVFTYAANVFCDRHNYVMGFTVNPRNVHDSAAFPEIYEVMPPGKYGQYF